MTDAARPAWRVLPALVVVLGLVVGACAGPPGQPEQAGRPAGTTLTMPLPAGDHVGAFRDAEAKLRTEGREQAELSKLGPGAVEFAGLMDQTASFLLTQLPRKLAPGSSGGPGGRLAAPFAGLPPPGAPVFGTYLMTTVLFNELVAQAAGGKDSKTATLDPTIDEVTVSGNKGTITTTTTATVALNGSKVSLDITMKVEGEVRDAATGAILYKISSEATGHADGDSCPDASGTARVQMAFGGKEDYFDASGTKTGTKVSESFSGEIRFKADDNAKLSGVEISPTGHGAEIMLRIAATYAAPVFEKAWRSGKCIEVQVDPKGGEVDSDSVTDVTAKVKHKIEGNELDKPVEAKLTSGVKSIDPAGSKQKAPAKFRYTAGSAPGDQGGVTFESVSNRGIGQASVTFTVGGGWTISSTGTSTERVQGMSSNDLRVSIRDLKVTAGKDGALTGSGTMNLSGTVTAGAGICIGTVDQTLTVTASGTLVGTGPGAVLRLTLYSPATAGEMVTMTCTLPTGARTSYPVSAEGLTDRYGEALGEFELPADGGTKAINRTAAIGGIMDVAATGTFTVVRPKR